MTEVYIDVEVVTRLTGESERSIQRKASEGIYNSRKVESVGRSGLKYKILLSSLPAEAQIRYMQSSMNASMGLNEVDMNEYKKKFGEDGLKELAFRHELVIKAIEIEKEYKRQKTEMLSQLAKQNDVGERTLYRWVSAYNNFGTSGLMRKLERETKGVRKSICLEAKRFLVDKYLTKAKRKKTVVYEMLLDYATDRGNKACDNCMYREGTEARANLELQGMFDVPVCKESTLTGIKVTAESKTISRILKEDITSEILDYARNGRKYWEAAYMQKAVREKPNIANKCWFGDHHVFDIFVYDKDGKIGKPWLTAWYDIGSGCMVGWCLSMNPNSRTIAEALVHGMLEKDDVPFCGVPEIVYTDNGKDYRSHVFEGGKVTEMNYGKMNYNLETEGIIKQLNIMSIHAKAYHGWAKPIERWFKTIEERNIRGLPGWCGNNPTERPEDFDKDLKRLAQNGELLSLDEFKDRLVNVILPDYHTRPHTGYKNEKPLERYQTLEKARDDKPSWALLAIAKMESEERKVTTQGIHFNNCIYWHKDLRHMALQTVQIKFNRERKDVIIVVKDGRTICAATIRDRLKMVLENEDIVAQHIADQHRQENEVKDRILELTGRRKAKTRKMASSNVLTGDYKKTSNPNVTAIQYEKALKEYEKASEPTSEIEEGRIKKRFEKIGEQILERNA